jgi:hypothetical protein
MAFERKVTAPSWGESIPERLSYIGWNLEVHPEMLEEFFHLADDFHRRNPTTKFGAPLILSVMRYNSNSHATDDVFAVNNSLGSAFVFLYAAERPAVAPMLDMRSRWLRSLSAAERAILDTALDRGRLKLEARGP